MQAARDMLRRFGFIGVLLMMFATVQPAWAAACLPEVGTAGVEATVGAAAPASDPCGDDCQDCIAACAHGCCHAHAAALTGTPVASLPSVRFAPAAHWTNALAPPGDARTGPERPPRA